MVDQAMDRSEKKSSATLVITKGQEFIDKTREIRDENFEEKERTHVARKYYTKHMKMYPELYRSDVSIHPSYTGLKNLPYHVVCRRRALKKKKQISRQLNREIMHIAMMQSHALGSVRIDRIFSIGFPPEATHVPDFATRLERRRINQLLTER